MSGRDAQLLAALLLDGVGDAARAALPVRLIDRLGLRPRLVRLAPGGTSVLLPDPAGVGPIWGLLDPGDVLRLDEPCPANHALDLWRVLSLRLPDLLPLRPDLLAWDIVPTGGGGRIYAVRRSVLAAAAATISAAGWRCDRLGVAGEDGVDFLRLDGRRLRRAGGRALLLTACLWLGAVLPPLAWAGFMAWDVAKLETALARDVASVREVADMRDRIAFLAEQQRTGGLLLSQPPRGPLLDRVAALLPDDAVLVEMSLDEGGMRLRGRAADAGAVLARLRADAAFADARFANPIIPTSNGQGEIFTIATGGER